MSFSNLLFLLHFLALLPSCFPGRVHVVDEPAKPKQKENEEQPENFVERKGTQAPDQSETQQIDNVSGEIDIDILGQPGTERPKLSNNRRQTCQCPSSKRECCLCPSSENLFSMSLICRHRNQPLKVIIS